MGSNVSANTLFHFTSSLENIESILANDFYPRYCLEDHRMFVPDDAVVRSYFERAIPMVCFCDIPLSQIRRHIKRYGGYAIGLSKTWGEQQKISPIMYVSPNSNSTTAMKECFVRILDKMQINSADSGTMQDFMSRLGFLLDSFIMYTKPYQCVDEKVVFYDEREWRYIPNPEERVKLGMPLGLTKDEFMDDQKREDANACVTNHFRLSFEPRDIKYIIVEEDSEILTMVDKVARIKGPKYNYDDVRLLTTRIISLNQILKDF